MFSAFFSPLSKNESSISQQLLIFYYKHHTLQHQQALNQPFSYSQNQSVGCLSVCKLVFCPEIVSEGLALVNLMLIKLVCCEMKVWHAKFLFFSGKYSCSACVV